eukprot:TRINITY_DN5811_c0_g1_i1.p1 TRINITY_DN5811_c0_g1~~TRINITY_DN5811_c0_g1_i1.p1  ORF type:complete len:344 (+),score=50.59 TRINITY_DN5811_c0_g1_i1:83-1033(+)
MAQRLQGEHRGPPPATTPQRNRQHGELPPVAGDEKVFAAWLAGAQYCRFLRGGPPPGPPPRGEDEGDAEQRKDAQRRLDEKREALKQLRKVVVRRPRRCLRLQLTHVGTRRGTRPASRPGTVDGHVPRAPRLPRPPRPAPPRRGGPSPRQLRLKAALAGQAQLSSALSLFPPLLSPYDHAHNAYRGLEMAESVRRRADTAETGFRPREPISPRSRPMPDSGAAYRHYVPTRDALVAAAEANGALPNIPLRSAPVGQLLRGMHGQKRPPGGAGGTPLSPGEPDSPSAFPSSLSANAAPLSARSDPSRRVSLRRLSER